MGFLVRDQAAGELQEGEVVLVLEHRDGHINSGMEGGMQISMDCLEEVAISLR